MTRSATALGLAGLFCIALLLPFAAHAAPNTFNELVRQKQVLERDHGVATLECFPFLEKIGGKEEEVQRILDCLKGVNTLAAALKQVPDAGLRTVGISTRFLRTGGFQTILMPWDADTAAVVRALKDRLPAEEQKRFMDQILKAKEIIQDKFSIRDLYCSLTISNDQCLQGYETLASVEATPDLRRKMWSEVIVTDSHRALKNQSALPLKYDAGVEVMTRRMKEDTARAAWTVQQKAYEEIQQRFGETFRKLQLPNFFCEPDLTPEECIRGAESFHKAAQSDVLQSKTWGKVTVTRYNTRVRSDYDATFRYDLTPEDIVEVFSAKPSKREIELNVTRAEKLEERTKNNSTGLRAVCDLTDLMSALCVQGFERFIDFVRAHRDFRAARPWTEVMFVDGTLLSRINFALNSNSREHYIYIDARSTPEEFESHLMRYGAETGTPVR